MLTERVVLFVSLCAVPHCLQAENVPANNKEAAFTVTNRSDPPKVFSADEIDKMPHIDVQAEGRTYNGVRLSEFLQATDVIWEGKCSPLLTCYLLAEGSDGYRILFSVPEIDPNQCHKNVILADRCDGKPLSKADGPYQIIEEDAKQHGRWVRHASAITLIRALPHAKPKSRPPTVAATPEETSP